jgi:hypothetical protein
MRPTRRTQPYRKKGLGRPGGRPLAAMLAGRTVTGHNPQDAKRELEKRARRKKKGLAAKLSARTRTFSR